MYIEITTKHLVETFLKNQQFADWLLEVGSGHILIDQNGIIPLPQWIAYGPNLLSLIQVVYNGVGNVNSHKNEYFKDRITLFTWNDIVDNINNDIIDIFLRVVQTILSANVALIKIGVNNNNLYPTKYLNFLDLSVLLPSNEHLKVGCPIMLLQYCSQM